MSRLDFPPLHLITDTPALLQLVEQVQAEALLAVDMEANSMYAYYDHVCLIQLSVPQADYIIDPLPISDLSPLNALMANPALQKVLHSSEYDLMCLRRDFGFQFQNIFDTKYAARLLGQQKVSLADLVKQFLGLEVDKRWQKANWGLRPLSDEHLTYARMDSRHLLALHAHLYPALEAAGHLPEAAESFAEMASIPANISQFDPEGFWRIPGSQKLRPIQLGCLKAAYLWRENIAQQMNLPPHKLLNNEKLLKLARKPPRSMEQLHQSHLLNGYVLRLYGKVLLRALAEGGKKPPEKPRPPRTQAIEMATIERYERLKRWRRDQAEARQLESDMILSKDVLWAIARANPKSPADLALIPWMGPWRVAQYGPSLLSSLGPLGALNGALYEDPAKNQPENQPENQKEAS
jgi:ribonuclease D